MPEIKRFRVNLPTDVAARLSVGDRYVCEPGWITEDWDLTTGGGRSYVPKRSPSTTPRPGVLVKAVSGGGGAIFQDVEPYAAPTAAIVTVFAPRMLAPVHEVAALLRHVSGLPVTGERDLAGVANAVEPWLRGQFHVLAMAARRVHDDPAMVRVWLDGLTAGVGRVQWVPAAPFNVVVKPKTSPNLGVRGDVIDRLLRRGRAN